MKPIRHAHTLMLRRSTVAVSVIARRRGVTAVYAGHDYAVEKRAVELMLTGRASAVVALRR
jgi:hypothetical protein